MILHETSATVSTDWFIFTVLFLSSNGVLPDGIIRNLVDLGGKEISKCRGVHGVLQTLRSAWQSWSLVPGNRRKIDCILGVSLRAELEKLILFVSFTLLTIYVFSWFIMTCITICQLLHLRLSYRRWRSSSEVGWYMHIPSRLFFLSFFPLLVPHFALVMGGF